MPGSAVEVTGLTETRALLKRFEPDLLKRLDRTLTLVANDLKSAAQSNFESTGASGSAYRVRTRARISGFSKGVTTRPGSVGLGEHWGSVPSVLASVFEFLNGVRDSQPQNVQRTKSLVATLNSRYGKPGRFLWDAWDDRKAAAMATVHAEIKAVEAEYTERLRA